MDVDENYWLRPEELTKETKREIWKKELSKARNHFIREQQKLALIRETKTKRITYYHEYSPGYEHITPIQVEAIFPFFKK